MMQRSVIAVAALLAVSTGCKTVQTSMDKAETVAAGIALPLAEEKKLGNQVKAEVEGKSKLYTGAEVIAYVDGVGQKVAKVSPNPDKWRFTFKVIDDPNTINAFAIPGGTIYVYTGLLKAAKDESELAGVLAHEVAHVTSRHIAKRMVEAYGMQTLAGVALGNDPGTLAQIGASILTQGTLLKNSRDDESESDTLGLVATSRAGYDPMGMVGFFQTLKGQEGSTPAVLAFLSDHPTTDARIKAMQEEIRQKRLSGTARNVEAFAAIKQKL